MFFESCSNDRGRNHERAHTKIKPQTISIPPPHNSPHRGHLRTRRPLGARRLPPRPQPRHQGPLPLPPSLPGRPPLLGGRVAAVEDQEERPVAQIQGLGEGDGGGGGRTVLPLLIVGWERTYDERGRRWPCYAYPAYPHSLTHPDSSDGQCQGGAAPHERVGEAQRVVDAGEEEGRVVLDAEGQLPARFGVVGKSSAPDEGTRVTMCVCVCVLEGGTDRKSARALRAVKTKAS